MPSRSCAFCAAVSRFITARGSPTARAYAALTGAATACSSLGAVSHDGRAAGRRATAGAAPPQCRETGPLPPNGSTAVVLEGATRAVPRVAGIGGPRRACRRVGDHLIDEDARAVASGPWLF